MKNRLVSFQPYIWFAVVASVVIGTYFQLIFGALHGIDISDEGMYLLSAQRPTAESAFHNPFGDYTNLLYKLSFHQVWLFRVLGILILGLCGAAVTSAIYRVALQSQHKQIDRLTFALLGMNIAPFYYAIGLFTPSYNWLNLVALSLGCASIINLCNEKTRTNQAFQWTWASVFSIAVWIGTFAKMSTGPGLLAIFAVSFLISGPKKNDIKRFAIGSSATLIFLALFHSLFISSLSTVATKMSRGQKA